MIDALIADIQAHGPGNSSSASYFREAEFTPSSSSSSFADYLNRISHSPVQETTAKSDMYNDYEQVTKDTAAQAAKEAQYRQEASADQYREAQNRDVQRREKDHQVAMDREAQSSDLREREVQEGEQRRRTAEESEGSAGKTEESARKSGRIDQDHTKGGPQGTQDEAAKDQSDLVEKTGKELTQKSKNTKEASASGSDGSGKTKAAQKADAEKVAADKMAVEKAFGKKAEASVQAAEEQVEEEANKKIASDKASVDEASKERAEKAAHTRPGNEKVDEKKAQQLSEQQKTAENEKLAAAVEKSATSNNSRTDTSKAGSQAHNSKDMLLTRSGDEQKNFTAARGTRSNNSEDADGRPKLTIIDKRSPASRSDSQHNRGNAGNGNHRGGNQRSSAFNILSTASQGGGTGAENVSGTSTNGVSGENGDALQVMQVHLRGEGAQMSSASQTGTRGADTGVRNQLLQQLQDHLNNDIVKRSSILVRENGSGEIKLDLKPDNLGQVRIRITMENNHIAGKIFVENSSVKEAFDQNMQQLYRAFKEHGFEDAALNVSVGDQNRGQQERGSSQGPQPRVALQQVNALDEQSALVQESNGELRLVDVMA